MESYVSRAALKRWLKPEVYPLLVFIGGAVGLAAYALGRHLVIDPELRVNKDDRMYGRFDNEAEGDAYHNHILRNYLSSQPTQITPTINGYFERFLKRAASSSAQNEGK